VNRRYIDWIWHIRGSVALGPGQSGNDAFERLSPLFRERDTIHDQRGNTLTFRKENQAPQDKMAIYDEGVLRIEHGPAGAVLRYDLVSRALLYCFLAPLLFLTLAGITTGINMIDKPTAEEIAKEKKEREEREKRYYARPQNPIDKFLGAPAPEKPKTEEEKKKEAEEKRAKGEDVEDEDEPGDRHSPVPAYVFAGIFAALYIGGRILEAWLIRRRFRAHLLGETSASQPDAVAR